MIPYYFVNKHGSAVIESSNVTVEDNQVVYTFPNHSFANSNYRGVVYVKLNQGIPTTATTSMPIVFETNGVKQAVLTKGTSGETEWLVSMFQGVGYYEFFFDKQNNKLQLL